MHTHIHMGGWMDACVCGWVVHAHACMHACTHTHADMLISFANGCLYWVCVCGWKFPQIINLQTKFNDLD